MGSCCSSELDQRSSMADRRASRSDDHSPSLESRAPPPTLDVETVKEVVLSVSETPKLRSKSQKHDLIEEKISAIIPTPVFPIFKLDGEISEVSEIESVSTTTNVTNDDDEIGHYHRSAMKLPKNRSFSGDLGATGRRERVVAGKSPSWRSEQSPGRKTGNGVGSVRIVQSSNPGRITAERSGSGRRSRSPALSRADSDAARRSPSARRAGRSPGRVNGAPNERVTRRRPGKSNDANDESFDNPLVSLECFIFL